MRDHPACNRPEGKVALVSGTARGTAAGVVRGGILMRYALRGARGARQDPAVMYTPRPVAWWRRLARGWAWAVAGSAAVVVALRVPAVSTDARGLLAHGVRLPWLGATAAAEVAWLAGLMVAQGQLLAAAGARLPARAVAAVVFASPGLAALLPAGPAAAAAWQAGQYRRRGAGRTAGVWAVLAGGFASAIVILATLVAGAATAGVGRWWLFPAAAAMAAGTAALLSAARRAERLARHPGRSWRSRLAARPTEADRYVRPPARAANGHPAIFPVRRTAERVAGPAIVARSPRGPGRGPAARPGIHRRGLPPAWLTTSTAARRSSSADANKKKGTMSWPLHSLAVRKPAAHPPRSSRSGPARPNTRCQPVCAASAPRPPACSGCWVPPSTTRGTLLLEYLVTTSTHVPAGTPEQAIQDVRARESARASEPAPQGTSCGRGVRRCSRARASQRTGRAGHRSLRPSARPAGPAEQGRPAPHVARGGSRCPAW